jgi:predicted 2-oxoglutarate/Fe(II)-dependent dioxygenase YbiX
MESMVRSCLECGKSVKGRADKKFCDDYCRNAYNNRQNSEQNNFVRNVNNSLKKNRRVLEGALPEGGGMVKTPRHKLLQQGFDFKFHTHQYTNKNGSIYFFCYEYGYLPLDGDWILVVKKADI